MPPAPPPFRKKGFAAFLARVISIVFHPVFYPTVMSLVLYYLLPASFASLPKELAPRWLGVIALLTIFFPVITLVMMKALGFIQSIYLRTSRERIMPLVATMIFYFWVSHVFNNFPQVPILLRALLLGSFYAIIGVFMANIFVKISMHTAAAGGMLALMSLLLFSSPANMFLPVSLSLIIAGLIGTARMYLKEHRMAEIWLGYFVGFAAQMAAWLWLI